MPTLRRRGSHPDCRCLPIQIAALQALTAAGPIWRSTLRTAALDLFDEAAPLDPSTISFAPKKSQQSDERRIPRIVEARRNLLGTLEGRGAVGTKLFEALLLPLPERRATRARRAAAKEPA